MLFFFFQQVINTIKSKHYSYNSFDTVNGAASMATATVIKNNRNARKFSFSNEYLDNQNVQTILHGMHNLKD